MKNLLNIYYFTQGWSRYYLYYSKLAFKIHLEWLIRGFIFDQIRIRINTIVDTPCYLKGSCIKCGCGVTALQMANKSCDGNCYPSMLSKKEWKQISKPKGKIIKNNYIWTLEDNKFKKE